MGVRVLTVLGTRPEAIKLFPVIHALEADPRFDSRVCLTGQHRAMVDEVLTLADIAPDHDLALFKPGQSLDALAASALTGVGGVLDREQPDWVVVQGDTTSAMAAALAAHHRRIPICHVEAGLRSGDLLSPWPEEANRRIVTAIAQLHCAPTETAAAALRAAAVAPQAIHVTGNTGIDALLWMRTRLARDGLLAGPARALAERFSGCSILTVTLHRRENLGPAMEGIADALARLAARSDIAIVIPMHPNPVVRAVLIDRLGSCANVALIEPLGYGDFVCLLGMSHLVLTDSGGVQEEAPALGTPVLVLRTTTERPEAILAGTALLVGIDPATIVQRAAEILACDARRARMARGVSPYGDGSAAPRVAALLAEAREARFPLS